MSAPSAPVDTQPSGADMANAKLENNKLIGSANAAMSVGMTTNLFGCFADIVGCFLSCCVPCIPAAATGAALQDRDCTICDCLFTPNPYQTRQHMRAKYNLGFAEIQDTLTFFCCTCCFISQNTREYAALTNGAPVYFSAPKGQ